MKYNALILAISTLMLAACNDDDNNNSGTPTQPTVLTAKLNANTVEGLNYASATQKGTTTKDGSFTYVAGETVTFKLGNLTLGSIKPTGGTVLLKNLDNGTDAQGTLSNASINRAILLQTLDKDNDSYNGIQLDPASIDKLTAANALDFRVSTDQFISLLTNLKISSNIPTAQLARHMLLTSEAEAIGKATEKFTDKPITQIDRYVIADQYVPYEGTDAEVKKKFPNGFPLAVGSGLGHVATSNGVSTFYAITDRGPNADSPTLADGTATKVFPSPAFAPTLVKLTVDAKGITLSDVKPLLNPNKTKVTGLPLPKGSIGSTNEVALTEKLTRLMTATDANGLDTEAVAIDPDGNHIWTCDEYGPFIAKVNIATGTVVKKFAPETGLPALIAKRQPNRGCEGLAYDAGSKKLYAMVQSTLDISKNSALFTRLVEFDPITEKTTKTVAYPINPADWEEGKAGKAKLGDLVALGNGRFMTIEQGTFADGRIHNKLFTFDISKASDITGVKSGNDELEKVKTMADLAKLGVVTATKDAVLADLKDYGWLMEKAEGLALIDSTTLALINDNDFGVSVDARDKDGKAVDATDLKVDDKGQITDKDGKTGYVYKITNGKPEERRTQLWIIKLAKPVK